MLFSQSILTLVIGTLGVSSELLGIPTVPFKTSSKGKFDIKSAKSITFANQHADTKDTDGWTLIPPTLSEFAHTFADDLQEVLGQRASVNGSEAAQPQSIFLTIGNNTGFTDVAGRWTSEAYAIDVKASGITITGASPLGVWWGTRTILQQAALHNGKIALGSGVDAPGWNTRGLFVCFLAPHSLFSLLTLA